MMEKEKIDQSTQIHFFSVLISSNKSVVKLQEKMGRNFYDSSNKNIDKRKLFKYEINSSIDDV